MRIIAGKLKGRKLVSFKADHIRPTTDRVKESIFNILQAYIPDSRVLDLFSGTGNLALESFSRGANFVLAVEKHKGSLRILRENLKKMNVEREIEVCSSDVQDFLRSYQGSPFDIILIDPPFPERMSDGLLLKLSQSRVLKPGTRIVIESSREEKVQRNYPDLNFLDEKFFGDKKVSFFEKMSNGEEVL